MNSSINISQINSTNTIMYMEPMDGRQNDIGFNASKLNFTWVVASFSEKNMKINLNFSDPLYISPSFSQDKLVIILNGSQYLLRSKQHLKVLNNNFWKL